MAYRDRIAAGLLVRAQDGVSMLLLGLFLAALSGAIMKLLAEQLPTLFIVWVRFLLFTLIIAPIVISRFGFGQAIKPVRPWVQLARGLMMVVATACFLAGSRSLDYAEAISVLYVYPFIIALLGPLLLREPTTTASWLGVVGGFFGVLIVARPSTSGLLAPGALWILACGVMVAGQLMLNRVLGAAISPLLTSLWGACVVTITLSPLIPWFWQMVTPTQLGLFALLGVLAAASQTLFAFAFARSSPSELAPLTYTEIVAAIGIGFAVFGTLPDLTSCIGIAVIIISGIFVARTRPGQRTVTRRQTKI